MGRRNEAVRTAKGCLPRYAVEIERAYEESGGFHAICTELHACMRALTYWKNERSGNAPARVREYETLREELKCEVLAWLGAHGLLHENEGGGSAESEKG